MHYERVNYNPNSKKARGNADFASFLYFLVGLDFLAMRSLYYGYYHFCIYIWLKHMQEKYAVYKATIVKILTIYI